MRVSIEILEQLTFLNDLPFEMTIIRNGFGITPKGPMGPFPARAPKAPLGPPWALYPPWGPLAPIAPPGSPLAPLGSLGGWGGSGALGVPLGPRDRHLVGATKERIEFGGGATLPERGYWVGGMRVSVFGLYFETEKCPAGAFWADKIVWGLLTTRV